jgi:acyl carrier protein
MDPRLDGNTFAHTSRTQRRRLSDASRVACRLDESVRRSLSSPVLRPTKPVDSGGTMTRDELQLGLREYIGREILEGDDEGLDFHTPLLETGTITSISLIHLLRHVEDRFGIHVPPHEMTAKNLQTIESMTTLLLEVHEGHR